MFQDLKLLYPLHGLKDSLKKLNKKEEVTDDELAIVVNFVDFFSTVSLHPAIVGPLVSEIAKVVNQHRHTKTCRKYQTVCRFKFPKLPSYKTIIARPPSKDMTDQEKKSMEIEYEAVIKKVKEVLENKETVEEILLEHPKETEETAADAFRGNLVDYNFNFNNIHILFVYRKGI